MLSSHAKSLCCGAKIYRFGSRRRQCSLCKRTWRIRNKKRGRKSRRAHFGSLKAVFLDGRTLKTLARRYDLTHQGLSWRFRRELRQFVARSRRVRWPRGPLVLVLDGLYFRFRRKDWVLYVMAVKPCHQNRAIFLDPLLLPGRENLRGWSQAITTIPAHIHRRIRASVSDEISGIIRLGKSQGWIVQLCHFHLISRLQNCRGRRNRNLAGRALREKLYQLTRQALEIREGPRLNAVLKELRRLVGRAKGMRVVRMIVREFLQRVDHFRAYQKFPELNLPTTTAASKR